MLDLDKFKIVDFHGLKLPIRKSHHYVFCDGDGEIRSSKHAPKEHLYHPEWEAVSDYIMHVGPTKNWRKTLVEYPRPFQAKGWTPLYKTVKAWGQSFVVPHRATKLVVNCAGEVAAYSGVERTLIGTLNLEGQVPPQPVQLSTDS